MKKQLVSIFCVALFAFGSIHNAQAQLRQSIFLDGNIPTGSFGKSLKADETLVPLGMANMGKDAHIGFGLGYRVSYRFDVGVGEVAPFAGADFLWNTIGSKLDDKYAGLQGSSPTYFNIPVQAGITYLYDELWNDLTPYGEFGLGVDFLFITQEKVGQPSDKRAYKPTGAFSWMLGAGVYFGKHVSAGLYYYGLGKHYIDYTKSTINDNAAAAVENATYVANHTRSSRNVGSLALRIGFHF